MEIQKRNWIQKCLHSYRLMNKNEENFSFIFHLIRPTFTVLSHFCTMLCALIDTAASIQPSVNTVAAATQQWSANLKKKRINKKKKIKKETASMKPLVGNLILECWNKKCGKSLTHALTYQNINEAYPKTTRNGEIPESVEEFYGIYLLQNKCGTHSHI